MGIPERSERRRGAGPGDRSNGGEKRGDRYAAKSDSGSACGLLGVQLGYLIGRCRGAIPPELLLVRAQASVFTIISKGDAEIRYPRSAYAWMTLLGIDFDTERQSLDPGVRKCDYFWEKVATDPRLLACICRPGDRGGKGHRERHGLRRQPRGHPPHQRARGRQPGRATRPERLEGGLQAPQRADPRPEGSPRQGLWGRLPPALEPGVLANLIRWMATQSTSKGTSHRIEVVLKYDRYRIPDLRSCGPTAAVVSTRRGVGEWDYLPG